MGPRHTEEFIYTNATAGMYLATDIAKRRSTCRLCGAAIVKGERRVALQNIHRRVQTRRGGSFSSTKVYFHATCMGKAIKPSHRRQVRRCPCGAPAHLNERGFADRGAGRGAYLCEDCSTRHYGECDVCEQYVPKNTLTTVTPSFKHRQNESRLCERCCSNWGQDSFSVKRQKELAEERIEGELAQIRTLLREGILTDFPADT